MKTKVPRNRPLLGGRKLLVLVLCWVFVVQLARADWNLSDEDTIRLRELQQALGEHHPGAVPDRFKIDKDYARIWVYLADTSQDQLVVRFALHAADRLYTANPGSGAKFNGKAFERIKVTPEMRAVVLKHLESTDTGTLRAAIQASGDSVWGKNPHLPTVRALLRLSQTHRDAVVRERALQALWIYQSDSPDFAKAILAGLRDNDYPTNLRAALDVLSHHYQKYGGFEKEWTDLFTQEAVRLLSDESPDVRTQASYCLYIMIGHSERRRVGTILIEQLNDGHPYTRSQAAYVLALMRYEPAVHELVLHLGDRSDNSLSITREKTTLRTPGSVLKRVDDAMLRAIHRISAGKGRSAFKYSLYETKRTSETVAEQIGEEAQRAKLWYTQKSDKFPFR